MPEYKFVTLEDTPSIGIIQGYSCSLEQISDFRHEMRYRFWHDFLGNAPTIPLMLHGLDKTCPSQDKDGEQEVFYTTTLAQDQADDYVLTGYPAMLQGGEYVMFTYEGLRTDMQEFILTVYGARMPMLNLACRKGQDIGRCYSAGDAKAGGRPINLRCKLLIPIHR